MLSLREAAARTGKSRQALRKAIATGRIRGERDVAGNWRVDPASLFTAYPPAATEAATSPVAVDELTRQVDRLLAGQEQLYRELLAGKDRLLAVLEDRTRETADEAQRLRAQLEEAQRRATEAEAELARLRTSASAGGSTRPPWWRRLFGR